MLVKFPPHPPLIRWVNYQSADENNPDILELKVIGTETTTTPKGNDVVLLFKSEAEWIESTLRLKWHNSRNASLLQQWRKYVKNGRLIPGSRFRICTWMGTTKTTKRPIRRFRLEF